MQRFDMAQYIVVGSGEVEKSLYPHGESRQGYRASMALEAERPKPPTQLFVMSFEWRHSNKAAYRCRYYSWC